MSNEDEAQLVLKNTIKPEDVKDIEKAIDLILAKISKTYLLKLYKIKNYENCTSFLTNIALKFG